MEKVRRLEPLPETKRQLFLLSGNKCAFPGCEQVLLDHFHHFIGQICHIEAANEDGERFNPSQTNEERRYISNLVLMCPTHHGVTNNVSEYPVSRMREIKNLHESKAYSGNGLTHSSAETFIDETFSNTRVHLNNVDELPLASWGLTSIEIMASVNNFINVLSNIPRQTRSIFAHCIYSSFGEDYLEFDPREVITRLRIDQNLFISQTAVLQRFCLMDDVDNDEYPHKVRQNVISPIKDENQIWFLIMLREKCVQDPNLLLDIIENLNFIHLES